MANEQSHYIMEMTLFLLLRILEHRNNDRLLTEVLKGPKGAEVIKIRVVLFVMMNSRNCFAV